MKIDPLAPGRSGKQIGVLFENLISGGRDENGRKKVLRKKGLGHLGQCRTVIVNLMLTIFRLSQRRLGHWWYTLEHRDMPKKGLNSLITIKYSLPLVAICVTRRILIGTPNA